MRDCQNHSLHSVPLLEPILARPTFLHNHETHSCLDTSFSQTRGICHLEHLHHWWSFVICLQCFLLLASHSKLYKSKKKVMRRCFLKLDDVSIFICIQKKKYSPEEICSSNFCKCIDSGLDYFRHYNQLMKKGFSDEKRTQSQCCQQQW